ncbi:MAG: hypothetical protein V3R27_04845 [Pseudomonadales bacterium]|jgi:hypothetical protein
MPDDDTKRFIATDLREAAYMLGIASVGLLIGVWGGAASGGLITVAVIGAVVGKVVARALAKGKSR